VEAEETKGVDLFLLLYHGTSLMRPDLR